MSQSPLSAYRRAKVKHHLFGFRSMDCGGLELLLRLCRIVRTV